MLHSWIFTRKSITCLSIKNESNPPFGILCNASFLIKNAYKFENAFCVTGSSLSARTAKTTLLPSIYFLIISNIISDGSCKSAAFLTAQSPVHWDNPAKIAECSPKFLDNLIVFILESIFASSFITLYELSFDPSSTNINSYSIPSGNFVSTFSFKSAYNGKRLSWL